MYRVVPIVLSPAAAHHRRIAPTPLRIVLEVEILDETVTGQASAADGTSRRFTGWLGLLNVLQALLSPSEPPVEADE